MASKKSWLELQMVCWEFGVCCYLVVN